MMAEGNSRKDLVLRLRTRNSVLAFWMIEKSRLFIVSGERGRRDGKGKGEGGSERLLSRHSLPNPARLFWR